MNLCERIKNGECPFGMLKEGQTMGECPSGFPGCGCMDELMLDSGYMDELTKDLESQVSGDEAVAAEDRWLSTLLPIAQSHAQAVVYQEFVTLLNPKYRGPNWKWEAFEEFAVRHAEVSAYQSFSDSDWNKYENHIRETARRTARIWAKTVMQDSGLMDWWPNLEKVTPDNFDGTRPKSLATTNLDFDKLREKLREYDKNVPRCPITRQKEVTWGDFVGHETLTCCRPEGHEGECRGSRLVLGWPGYETISELIRLAEIATGKSQLVADDLDFPVTARDL